jgi:uncharacterized HAD superfamily protein
MKDFTIGIDVDGVLRDNLQIMVDLYNENFKKSKEVSDIKDFRTEITFPDIEPITGKTASEWFFQDHSKEIFLNASPFYNVAEDIKRLRELANVVIITYQKSLVNRMHTLCWLEINGIEYDGLIFIKDKTKFICDYLIDDNDWNFLGSNAKHGILIDAPYNEGKSVDDICSSSNCESIVRYKNLHEFTEDFCKLYS